MSVMPSQPLTPEDELRGLKNDIHSAIICAVVEESSLDKSDALVYPREQQKIYLKYTDKIMALIKRKELGWRSVKDEMPIEGELVLARMEWMSGKEVYAVLEHRTIEDNEPWIYDGDELIHSVTVTHWKRFERLPSNPQKGK